MFAPILVSVADPLPTDHHIRGMRLRPSAPMESVFASTTRAIAISSFFRLNRDVRESG
jgi:hypothetical protein